MDVRIAAAEALYKRGESVQVKKVLEAALQHPEEMIRVHALNVLSFMDPKFIREFFPLLEGITGGKSGGRDYDMRAGEHLLEKFAKS